MQIQQMMMQQQSMFASNMAYSQQIGAPMQQAMGMQSPSPWSAPAYSMQRATAPYGERMAMGMASFGANVAAPTMMGAGALMGGMGMLGAAGHLFDPFGSALSGGAAGFARGGVMGAMGGAAMGALPGYLAMKAADVYGGAFMGGVRDQSGINQMMRSNFNFYGGQGAGGRGFSQAQMGQVGNALQNTASRDLTTSLQELTQLTQMGAQSGQFNGVRDVQQFTAKFKQMLTSLKTIQTELGGTLTDAMAFTQNANRSGVFRNLDSYASQMRTAQGATGMSQAQLTAMSEQGAGLSQMMGGRRAQGARGALRMATSLGSAYSGGIINDEALQEATGASGAEGIQALTGRLMEHTARFSRRAMGRYSIFGMSNAQGTGLDESAVNAMMSGGTSVGELSRNARRNVHGMGRARAINNEGLLRGSLLEQGGLAGQIGIMRMAVGDRVLDQGDDMASLFMQRRMRMSRPEAEIMTSLMRNQGTIATQEAIARTGTRRETAEAQDRQQNHSIEAFTARLGHAAEEGLGVSAVRDMGRRLTTRLSEISEKVMNRLLGIAETSMSSGDRAASARFSLGAATGADITRISRNLTANMPTAGTGGGLDTRGQGMLEGGRSIDAMLRGRGLDTETQGRMGTNGLADRTWVADQTRAIEDARRGRLTQREDLASFGRINDSMTMRATIQAYGAHETTGANVQDAFYASLSSHGVTANAVDAYNAQRGRDPLDAAPTSGQIARRGGQEATGRASLRDHVLGGAARGAGYGLAAGAATGAGALVGAGIGALVGGIGGAIRAGSEMTDIERANAFIASGGHQGRSARAQAEGAHGIASISRTGRLADGRNAANVEGFYSRQAAGLAVSPEAIAAVTSSDDFRSQIDTIRGLSGEAQARAVERLSAWAQGGATPEERRARMSVASQIQFNHQRTGSIGTEFSRVASVSPADTQRQLAEIDDRASFLSSLGGNFTAAAESYKAVQSNWNRGNSSGVDSSLRSGQGGERAEMDRMAHLSTEELNTQMQTYRENMQGGPRREGESEEEYATRASSVSPERREQFNQMERSVRQRQGIAERLSGKGRRGRQGAREEAFQQITGGNVTEGITLGTGRNQRTVTDRNAIMQLLRRGAGREGSEETSAEFQAVARQLYQQSGSQGGEAQFANLLRDTTRAGGKLSPELQTRVEAAGRDPGVSARQQEALAAQQRARDPLGQQQVDLLRQINEGIRGIPGNTGDVSPAENTSHL